MSLRSPFRGMAAMHETPKSDKRLANIASYVNLSKEVVPWAISTGFRTSAFRFRSLGEWDQPRVAEEFLIGSRLSRNDPELAASVASYLSDSSLVMVSMIGEELSAAGREIKLPAGIRLSMGVTEAIHRRRSIRTYSGDELQLDYLATLLQSSAGLSGSAEPCLTGGGKASLSLRSAPSGGGLYPIDIYVAALHVQGLERNIYQYLPKRNTLVKFAGPSEVKAITSSLAGPEGFISISNANAIFLLMGRPWRSMRKYGARGLRFLFIEAGAVAENLNLACVAMGLASLDCASFYDDEVHEALAADGLYNALIHSVIVGQPG